MKEKFKKSILAIALIVLGVIIGLNALNITSINIFFDGWWTLIIIIPSLIGVIENKDTGSFIMLLVGVLLFLNSRGIYIFNIIWKLLIPVILIVMGLSVLKNEVLSKNAKKIDEIDDSEKLIYRSSFGNKHNIIEKEFKALNVEAVFGENIIDLRKVNLNEQIYIKVLAMFGEVTIYVPENAKVNVNKNNFFGSVENKGNYLNREIENKVNENIVNINASAIFGEVRII